MGKYLTIVFSIIAFGEYVYAFDKQHTVIYETRVIADQGGEPIDKYIPTNKGSEKRMKQVYESRASKRLVNAHFPVISTSLTVGPVSEDEAKDIQYQVANRPLFIIGYDPVSIQWLKENKALLAEKAAIGLVVNIETAEQMDELQAIVGSEVMMQPTPGDRLAEHLKIKHYPFYLDNQGVMR